MRHIEATFGGDLLAPLGNERHLMWAQSYGDGEHFVGAGHLEVEHRCNRSCEPLDVHVLDVSPILAQVRGDPVGAGPFTEPSRGDWIGLVATPRLPHGRDVIDVDVQSLSHEQSRSCRMGRRVARLLCAARWRYLTGEPQC